MKNIKILAASIISALSGAAIFAAYLSFTAAPKQISSAQKQPLYWVAPMDDSYRRDSPGKSPMGMDLVPVYAQESDDDDPIGTVSLSAAIENNLSVRTAKVTRGTLHSAISTVGYVKYDEDEIVHIHPRVEGWIEKQHIKAAGDPVKQGAPLYALYSPELVTAQEEYIIALKRASPSLINAARERLAALNVPQTVIEDVARSREIVRTITFFAPQSGFVNALNIRDGFFVQPGMTLMSIAQLNTVWVEAEVFERDAALVKAGMPVIMTVNAIKGKIWKGTVDYVAPALQAETRTLPVRLEFANSHQMLKPNMLANINIAVPSVSEAILVPKDAVIRTGTQDRVVLAMGKGKFRSVPVTTGRSGEQHTEIIEGLNANERVVTSAQFLIDSESSKSADFVRMTSPDVAPASVWAKGTVSATDYNNRQVTIVHEPVKEWDWPAMTMNFSVGDNVDINKLKSGQSLHFEMTRHKNTTPVITGIHIMAAPAPVDKKAKATHGHH